MTSSSKVVKADRQTLARQRISVQVPLTDLVTDVDPDMQNAFGEVIERAKGEARAILEEAQMKAEELRQEARDQGYQEGLNQGREQGRQEVTALWTEIQQRLKEPLDLVAQSQNYLARLDDEATLALAASLTMAVFSRLKLERLDVVAAYIEELASSIDKDKVTVFLDPTWGPRLKALEENLRELTSAVTVAVDDTLESGIMRAETDGIEGALGGPLLTLKALIQEVLG